MALVQGDCLLILEAALGDNNIRWLLRVRWWLLGRAPIERLAARGSFEAAVAVGLAWLGTVGRGLTGWELFVALPPAGAQAASKSKTPDTREPHPLAKTNAHDVFLLNMLMKPTDTLL